METSIPQQNKSEEYFKGQIEKIIPKQKPIDPRDFFQRNKKLIITIALILLILFIAVNIYVYWGINYAYNLVNNIN